MLADKQGHPRAPTRRAGPPFFALLLGGVCHGRSTSQRSPMKVTVLHESFSSNVSPHCLFQAVSHPSHARRQTGPPASAHSSCRTSFLRLAPWGRLPREVYLTKIPDEGHRA